MVSCLGNMRILQLQDMWMRTMRETWTARGLLQDMCLLYAEDPFVGDLQFSRSLHYLLLSQSTWRWLRHLRRHYGLQDWSRSWVSSKVEFDCIVIVRVPSIWRRTRCIMRGPST